MSWLELGMLLFKGPFAYIWPLVLLPAAASLLGSWAAFRLGDARADWRLAAILAGLPGLIMLALALTAAIPPAPHPGDSDSWQEIVRHWVTPSIALLIVGSAVLKAILRDRALRSVTSRATAPTARLVAAAEAVGIVVQELPTDEFECFVAGVVRPRAYVTTGAVRKLADAELRAMLHHERAHICARDPALLTLLSFLHDLAPCPGALNKYIRSREHQADQAAVEREGVVAVASALLTTIRPNPTAIPAVGMSTEAGAWRLQAILATDQPLGRRSAITFAAAHLVIAMNLAFCIWPAVQHYTRDYLHSLSVAHTTAK